MKRVYNSGDLLAATFTVSTLFYDSEQPWATMKVPRGLRALFGATSHTQLICCYYFQFIFFSFLVRDEARDGKNFWFVAMHNNGVFVAGFSAINQTNYIILYIFSISRCP